MVDFNRIWQIAPRKAASVLGPAFALYRPNGAGPAIASANARGNVPAWITADEQLRAVRPLADNKSRAFACIDPALAQVGDYIIGQQWNGGQVSTWFVQSMDLPAPISVVRCNHTLTFMRPGSPAPGANFYGGDVTATETPIITGWPASVLQGTKGQTGPVNLPGDDRLPWVNILLPVLPAGVQIRAGDFAVDDQPQPMRYEVSGAVATPQGWAITAALTVA